MVNVSITQFVVTNVDSVDEVKVLQPATFFNPDGTPYEGLPSAAEDISYDGTLESDNVGDALDELDANDTTLAAATTAVADDLAAKLPDLITVATAIGTAAKTTAADEPASGSLVPIKFTNGNSADTPTVAFDGGTARAIKLAGTAVDADNFTLAANGVALFYFDGTVLHQIGVYV